MSKHRRKNPDADRKFQFAVVWDIAPAPKGEYEADWLVRVKLKNGDSILLKMNEDTFDEFSIVVGRRLLLEREAEDVWNLVSDKEVAAMAEPIIQRMSDEDAAEAWSTLDDNLEDELNGIPVEWYIEAEFGDAIAINGDLVTENTKIEIPKDAERVDNHGGRVPETETEISIELVAQILCDEMGLERTRDNEEYIEYAIGSAHNHKEFAYWGSSGDTEAYVVYLRPRVENSLVIAVVEVVEGEYYSVLLRGKKVADFANEDDALNFVAQKRDYNRGYNHRYDADYDDLPVLVLDAKGKLDWVELGEKRKDWKVIRSWEPER